MEGQPNVTQSDTLNKIKPVKIEIEDLISKLGSVSSSSECGPRNRRGILGVIGDMMSRLSCIDEHLDSITKSINADNVDAVNDSLDDLASLMARNQDPQIVNTIAYGSDSLGSLQHNDEYRNTDFHKLLPSAFSFLLHLCYPDLGGMAPLVTGMKSVMGIPLMGSPLVIL